MGRSRPSRRSSSTTSDSPRRPISFAPRRVGDSSAATPECRRPEELIILEPGATIAERWELPFDMSRTLKEVGSAAGKVSMEAIEARDPNEMEYSDIVYFTDEDAVREGRVGPRRGRAVGGARPRPQRPVEGAEPRRAVRPAARRRRASGLDPGPTGGRMGTCRAAAGLPRLRSRPRAPPPRDGREDLRARRCGYRRSRRIESGARPAG